MTNNIDRRLINDRRKQAGFNLRLLIGNGQRRTFRRQEDRTRVFFVDQYSPILFIAIVSILFLCVIDTLLTLFLLNHGAYETNPVMAYLLNCGLFPFLIYKFAITTFATLGLLFFKGVVNHKFNVTSHSLLYFTAMVYAAIVAWELYLICYVI